MIRPTTLAAIVAGLNDVLGDVAAAAPGDVQIVGWRGQQAHTPPSAWINLQPVSTGHERGGRIRDTLPFELWLTIPPAPSENDELAALATLTDIALPIVDAACAPSAARDVFGADTVRRTGFQWTVPPDGSTTVPALLITIAVHWTGTYC